MGNFVIVGVNSDKSVKRLKGEARPVNSENDRVDILKAIRYVDYVVVFEEDTPYNLIKKIQPDIIVKGGDYSKEKVVGNDLCEVVIFNYLDGYSTTKTIKNISDR